VADLRCEAVVPVVIADHQGLISYVNTPFVDLFGWSPTEIVGLPLSTIIPRNLHDAHQLGFSRFLTSGKATLLNQPLKLRAVAKDGREFDAEHTISAEHHDGHWTFGATIRPLD
jgi:PAS domain S-box-containing protein